MMNCERVEGSVPIDKVRQQFDTYQYPFIVVVDQNVAIGICSLPKINQLLDSSFAVSLHGKNPVRLHMLNHSLIFASTTPLSEVFAHCFKRQGRHLFEDILVVDGKHRPLGLVPMEQLFKAQHALYQRRGESVAQAQQIIIEQQGTIKSLTAELERKIKELEQSSHIATEGIKLKTEILTNMSHEIRTPMNGIIGMLALLRESGLNEEQEHFATAVQNSADSLLTIIDDLFDLSNIEAGAINIEQEELPIWEFLEDCVKLIAQNKDEKELEFIVEIESNVPEWVVLDGAKYRKIIHQLINNAIKFTATGTIMVKLSNYHSIHQGAFLRTEIVDTGIGFDKDDKRFLFEAFNQADGSIKRRFGGIGLGLAICRKLATLMEGTLDCHSEPPKGSRFWLDLPLKPGFKNPGTTLQEPHVTGLSALVIVQQMDLNRHICQQLQKRGIRPISCSHLEEAMHLIVQPEAVNTFQLLLIDLERHASETVVSLQNLALQHSLKIIHISPAGDNHGIHNPHCLGLWKPVCPTELNKAIATLFPKRDADELPDSHSAQTPPTTHSLQTMNVLLVEDNRSNAEVALRMLKNLKQHVGFAGNGLKALECLRGRSFDCILMDCQMPMLDGYATTRSIRNGFHGVTQRDIYIIALTAGNQQSDKQRCIEAGMNDYVAKPMTQKNLAEALQRFQAHRASLEQP